MRQANMEATTSRLLRGIPILLLAWAAPPGAGAQDGGGAAWAGAAGMRLESYGFARPERTDITRISLLTVPLAAQARLAGRVRVTLQGGWASGRLVRADGGRATLSGPTDTEVRVAVPVAGDWMTLTGAAVIPTGRQRLTGGELEVAAVVASDLLPFAISHWGGGALGGAGVELAPRRGDFRFSVSGGYLAGRGYHALDGGGAYRPGDETYLLVAAGHAAGAGKATLEAGMHRFTRDRLGGADLYRAGNRYHLTASYALAGEGRVGGVAYAGVLHRERGAGLGALSQDLPAQDLGLLGLALRVPVGRGAVLPSVDGRVFHSADGVGQGFGGAIGAAAEVPARGAVFVPSARLRVGQVLVFGGTRSPFTGAELGLTLRGGRR
jgi:hypothetical protein